MNTPNQLSDTPRTDAAWAKTFLDDDDQCRAGNAATDMRDACATLERELAALTGERDQLRADYERACQTVAQMHAAAVGEVCGPRRGIVEDLSDLRAERDQLRADLERFTGHGLLDCHAICDQRDAATVERDQLRAAIAEMPTCRCDRSTEQQCELSAKVTALTAEREKAERYRLATLKLDAELAAERARLDAGTILLTVAGERVWHCGVDLRAAIDAGIKEDAK